MASNASFLPDSLDAPWQLFASSVVSPSMPVSYSVCGVPGSILQWEAVESTETLVRTLGLDELGYEAFLPVTAFSAVPFVLAALARDGMEAPQLLYELEDLSLRRLSELFPSDLLSFATYVAFGEVLPIELSPLKKIALGTLHVLNQAAKGAATAGGAIALGVLIAGSAAAAPPVLIVGGALGVALAVADDGKARADLLLAAQTILKKIGR